MGVKRQTYAQLYNKAYGLKKKDKLNEWLCRCLYKSHNFASKFHTSKNILKCASTQLLGAKLTAATVEHARITHGLCVLKQKMLLRRLQARLVRYLWRPGGPLFLRHLPMEFLVIS